MIFQIFLTIFAKNFHLFSLGAGVPVEVTVVDELIGILSLGLMEHPEKSVQVYHGPPVIKFLGTHFLFLLYFYYEDRTNISYFQIFFHFFTKKMPVLTDGHFSQAVFVDFIVVLRR